MISGMEFSHEANIERLESAFPSLSGYAFSEARKRSLAAGCSVMQLEGNVIYEVSPEGVRRKIKEVAPPIAVEIGSKLRIRK